MVDPNNQDSRNYNIIDNEDINKNFDTVFEKAYKNLKEIHFEGIYFRNDIGHQVRKNFSKEN